MFIRELHIDGVTLDPRRKDGTTVPPQDSVHLGKDVTVCAAVADAQLGIRQNMNIALIIW